MMAGAGLRKASSRANLIVLEFLFYAIHFSSSLCLCPTNIFELAIDTIIFKHLHVIKVYRPLFHYYDVVSTSYERVASNSASTETTIWRLSPYTGIDCSG